MEPIDTYRGEASKDLISVMDKYLEVSEQIRELEREKKACAAALMSAIEEAPDQKFEYGGGGVCFKIQSRISYSFSPSIVGIEAQLKAEKKAEIESGIAAVKSHTTFIKAERLRR